VRQTRCKKLKIKGSFFMRKRYGQLELKVRIEDSGKSCKRPFIGSGWREVLVNSSSSKASGGEPALRNSEVFNESTSDKSEEPYMTLVTVLVLRQQFGGIKKKFSGGQLSGPFSGLSKRKKSHGGGGSSLRRSRNRKDIG